MEKQKEHRRERHQFANEHRRQDSGSQKRSHVHSIQKGEEYEVTIAEVGKKGDGICYIEEYTVFVPNTDEGEQVRIKIKQVKETVAFADRIS